MHSSCTLLGMTRHDSTSALNAHVACMVSFQRVAFDSHLDSLGLPPQMHIVKRYSAHLVNRVLKEDSLACLSV